MFLLNRFPREFDLNGQRYAVVNNMKELNGMMNRFNGLQNLYTTVYAFKQTNHKTGIYDTAIIDKVFIEVDPVDKNGNQQDVLNEARKITSYLNSKKYFYNINWSGRGIHFFIYTSQAELKHKKQAIKNFVLELKERTQANIDMSSVGDIAREVRLVGSKNLKSGLYCIPLMLDEMTSSDEIKKLATQPRPLNKKYLLGEVLLDLSLYDDENGMEGTGNMPNNIPFNTQKPIEMASFKAGVKAPCVNEVLDDDHSGYAKRTLLLAYLKSHGFSLVDARHIVKSFISQEKYNKSNCTRHHADSYYARNYLLPSCKKIGEQGLCPLLNAGKAQQDCKVYNKLFW